MTVHKELLWRSSKAKLELHKGFSNEVGVVTLYPGLDFNALQVQPNWRILLLRTFGAGNAPNSPDFIEFLSRCSDNGTVIVNTSQCVSGAVVHGLYDSSSALERFNVLSAKDMTFESALVKAMLLLSETDDLREFGIKFSSSLAGELTE